MTMEERISVVASCRYVDEVIPDAPLIIDLKWIKKHNYKLKVIKCLNKIEFLGKDT